MEVSRREATHGSLAAHKPGAYLVLQGLQGKDTGSPRVLWTPRVRPPPSLEVSTKRGWPRTALRRPEAPALLFLSVPVGRCWGPSCKEP